VNKEKYIVDFSMLFDGKVTVAVIHGPAFTAAASTVCHPKDEFNPDKGKKTAFDRVAWDFAEHLWRKYACFRKIRITQTHAVLYSHIRKYLKEQLLSDVVVEL